MTDKITRPAFQSAYFSENPTETNNSIKIYVFVIDETIEPVSTFYSGEINSGEV